MDRLAEAPRNTILTGHALDVLRTLPDASVQAVITSPPYWGLRSYGTEPQVWAEGDGDERCEHVWGKAPRAPWANLIPGPDGRKLNTKAGGRERSKEAGHFCQLCGAWRGELGSEPTVELYVAHMVTIFREVRRVLRPDGTLWLNLGDSYASGGNGSRDPERWPKQSRNAEGFRSTHAKDQSGIPDKNQVLVPARVALALQADGWILRKDVIWRKTSCMPESDDSRPTSSHEHVFLFARRNTPTYWVHRAGKGQRGKKAPKADRLWIDLADGGETSDEPPGWREETLADGRTKRWQRINQWRGHDYFYDAFAIQEPTTGNTHSRGPEPRGDMPKAAQAERGTKNNSSFNEAIWWPVAERNKRDVWDIATQPFPEAHFATFPEDLAEICLLAGTSERGACEHCGAPWQRLVEARGGTIGRSWNDHQDDQYVGQRAENAAKGGHGYHRVELGWSPTCSCEGNTAGARCLVLDPFFGAATVGVVAVRLGCDYLGIELKDEFVGMGRRRLRRVPENLWRREGVS